MDGAFVNQPGPHPAPQQDAIEREVLIDAPAERVWQVLTEAGFLGTWFGSGTPAQIDLRPGGRLVLDHGVHGALLGRIERVEPPRLLSFRWSQGGPGEEPTEGTATLVQFQLVPVGTRTRLRVRESGFAGLAIPAPTVRLRHEQNSAGWSRKLDDLHEFLERQTA